MTRAGEGRNKKCQSGEGLKRELTGVCNGSDLRGDRGHSWDFGLIK